MGSYEERHCYIYIQRFAFQQKIQILKENNFCHIYILKLKQKQGHVCNSEHNWIF